MQRLSLPHPKYYDSGHRNTRKRYLKKFLCPRPLEVAELKIIEVQDEIEYYLSVLQRKAYECYGDRQITEVEMNKLMAELLAYRHNPSAFSDLQTKLNSAIADYDQLKTPQKPLEFATQKIPPIRLAQ